MVQTEPVFSKLLLEKLFLIERVTYIRSSSNSAVLRVSFLTFIYPFNEHKFYLTIIKSEIFFNYFPTVTTPSVLFIRKCCMLSECLKRLLFALVWNLIFPMTLKSDSYSIPRKRGEIIKLPNSTMPCSVICNLTKSD